MGQHTPNFCRLDGCRYGSRPRLGLCDLCKYNGYDNPQDDDCEMECPHCLMTGGHSESCICAPHNWGWPQPYGPYKVPSPHGFGLIANTIHFNERKKVMSNFDVLEEEQIQKGKLYGWILNGQFHRIVLVQDIVTGEKAQEMLNEDNDLQNQVQPNFSKQKHYLVTLTVDTDHRGQVWRSIRTLKDDDYGSTGLVEVSKKHEKYLKQFSEASDDFNAVDKAVKARLKDGFPSVMDELADVLEVTNDEVKEKLAKSPRLKKVLEKLDREID